MKNLMLTSLFLAVGFATYGQNLKQLFPQNATTITLLKKVVNKHPTAFVIVSKQNHLKCDFKTFNVKKSKINNSGITRYNYRSRDFFKKFYGRTRKPVRNV